ncbi:hypothetical protein D3C87_1716220 [compost metagenome]
MHMLWSLVEQAGVLDRVQNLVQLQLFSHTEFVHRQKASQADEKKEVFKVKVVIHRPY